MSRRSQKKGNNRNDGTITNRYPMVHVGNRNICWVIQQGKGDGTSKVMVGNTDQRISLVHNQEQTHAWNWFAHYLHSLAKHRAYVMLMSSSREVLLEEPVIAINS
jgi:hypothetical protein